MAFKACTKADGHCPRGYVPLRYHPQRCSGCEWVKSINGGNNNPTHEDGTPLTKEERSAVFKLRK